MSLPNLGSPSLDIYVQSIQHQVNTLQQTIDGSFTASGDLTMNGNSIVAADSITVGTLHYTALDPPVSSGGNVTAPPSSTDNAIARFDGVTGGLLQNSTMTLSDSGNLQANGSTVDMSTLNAINLVASAGVSANSLPVVVSNSISTNGDIAVFSGITGTVITDTGVPVASIADKLPLAGGTMTGSIAMGTNNLTNVGLLSGSTNSRNANAIVSSTASPSVDSNIAVFNGTTGVVLKESGVAVASIANKLPLTGGTMTGAIAMTGNNITNIGLLSGATNTSNPDNLMLTASGSSIAGDIATFSGTGGRTLVDSGVQVSSITSKLPLAGGTMSGDIDMNGNDLLNVNTISGTTKTSSPDLLVTTGSLSSVAGNVAVFLDASGNIIADSGMLLSDHVLGPASATSTALARFDGTTGKLIKNSPILLSDAGILAQGLNTIDFSTPGILNLTSASVRANGLPVVTDAIIGGFVSGPASAINADIPIFSGTTGKIIMDSGFQTSAITNKLPLAGGTMTGSIAMGGNNITNVGTLSGAVFSRTTDSIVSNTGASVAGHFAVFADGTGKTIQDGGTGSSYLPLAGGIMSGSIAMSTNNLTNVGTLSGATNSRLADDIVSNAGPSIAGDVAVFSGVSGKIITDTSIVSANLVSNAGASVAGNVATFSGVSGKVIIDSGASLSQYLPLAGGTMSGSIALGTNDLTNVGTLSGASNSRLADDIVSNAGASVAGNVATFSGVSGKVITDSGASLSQYLPLSGGTMSGTLNMGNNPITNCSSMIVNSGGIFAATNAYGAWYNTASYTPAFTAATNRLTPPATPTAGSLSQFTHASGVLTYTGTRTRVFHVSYNITVSRTSIGTRTMVFFNSINASTTLGTQASVSVTIMSTTDKYNAHLCDNISLSTNDTVQLAASCDVTTSNVSFTLISCNIFSLLT